MTSQMLLAKHLLFDAGNMYLCLHNLATNNWATALHDWLARDVFATRNNSQSVLNSLEGFLSHFYKNRKWTPKLYHGSFQQTYLFAKFYEWGAQGVCGNCGNAVDESKIYFSHALSTHKPFFKRTHRFVERPGVVSKKIFETELILYKK